MKILLLQEAVYLPTFGGGNKANRLLMEELAREGHRCWVIGPALTTRAGPTTEDRFRAELAARQVAVEEVEAGEFHYSFRGVSVIARSDRAESMDAYLNRFLIDHRPDRILLSDDKRHRLMETAVRLAAQRTVLLVHTTFHLPFGPDCSAPNPAYTERLRCIGGIVAVSQHVRCYLWEGAGLHSVVLAFPVYGSGPFANLARYESGHITLINPCPEKGVSIFLDLARALPELAFAAVPTWGAGEALLDELRRQPNVSVWQPRDDIEEILAKTRILLVPSLIPETFGYVVPEAMLRGIPVLAANHGGLVEAALGAAHLLPVSPARREHGQWCYPPQDLRPWLAALRQLIDDEAAYRDLSCACRQAALRFVAGVGVEPFVRYLKEGHKPAASAAPDGVTP